MLSLYLRTKTEAGRWRYQRIKEGRGQRTGHLEPPFYIRPFVGGKQVWHRLGAESFEEAKSEARQASQTIDAGRRGVAVGDDGALANANRIPIKSAIDAFLDDASKTKKAKTLIGYRHNLRQFQEALGGKIRFVDEISKQSLINFRNFLAAKGYEARTQHNRLMTALSFLKKHDIKTDFSLTRDLPKFEEEQAVPYTDEDLKKLWQAIATVTTGTSKKRANSEIVNGKVYAGTGFGAEVRYKFFLGTAARDKEVTYAAWPDIDFENKTYHIQPKRDVGFTIKNHESRIVPIPDSLIDLLKARKRNAPHPRWIFVNEDGKPDNHFLRKLKVIALKAGLNCGQCKSAMTTGRYDKRQTVEVTCKTHPVCEHIYLHRFRKTCATRWNENNVPIRTIQHWLGHRELETTVRYLGITDNEKLRGNINKAFGD